MAAIRHLTTLMFVLVAVPAANAQMFVSGTQLAVMCKNDIYGQCMAFVMGVSDAAAAVIGTVSKSKLYCLPQDATTGQVALVTKKYLDSHPENLNYGGAGLVLLALQGAFPCPSK